MDESLAFTQTYADAKFHVIELREFNDKKKKNNMAKINIWPKSGILNIYTQITFVL